MADKMKPEVKAKWIEDLRSGKYKQAKRVLRSGDNGYCCIGVLCESASLCKWSETPKPVELSATGAYFAFENGMYSMIDDAMADSVGLNMETCRQLARMNDNDGATFEQIAKWIEENL